MKTDQKNDAEMSLTSEFVFNFRKGSFISKKGEEIFLEARLKDFFTVLLNHSNDVVTRDELMSSVWKEVMVGDDSITKAAFDLRKFLTTHKINGVELITIRKLGYKLEIREPEEKNTSSGYLGWVFKLVGALLVILLLLIIGIRAISY